MNLKFGNSLNGFLGSMKITDEIFIALYIFLGIPTFKYISV